MSANLEDHKDHELAVDRFAQMLGVVRYIPGNVYCLTCHEPIEAQYMPSSESKRPVRREE